jgi:hypothetical protein
MSAEPTTVIRLVDETEVVGRTSTVSPTATPRLRIVIAPSAISSSSWGPRPVVMTGPMVSSTSGTDWKA